MRGCWVLAAVAAVVSVGCGDDDAGVGDAGTDAASGLDGGLDGAAMVDSGADAGDLDAGVMDAGFDAAEMDAGFDGGWDAGPEGCDPGIGIECDGDWTDHCSPACDATECCSPQAGRFACVPRADDGSCPAADIWVDESRAALSVEWREFPTDDCAIAEGCVDGAGWRRLLKFATWTPNTGTADLYLGPPSDTVGYFEYSPCHDHYHFDSYARYELRAADGTVVASGHKQAFCLLDFYRYPGTMSGGARYTCSNQGIQMGWQDVYGEHLDCQWVDVTAVAPGDYVLRIEVNFLHMLNESDYTNNLAEIPVTIPADMPAADVTVACPAGTPDGTNRSCGLTREATHTCTPGAAVRVGCSATCAVGECTGDPFVRICEPARDPGCEARYAIASNDDSGCGGGSCGRGGDCCPKADFTCPAGGEFTVFWGAYDPDDTATCTVAVE